MRFAVLFALSSAAVILAMELLFRAGGLSYIMSLRGVRRDIVFTSYDDGWVFLANYLLDVERSSGLVLVLGSFVYAWQLALRIRRGVLRPIDRLMLPALPDNLSDYAARSLTRMGVEVSTSRRVTHCDRRGVDTDGE